MGHINPGRISRPAEQPQSSVTNYDPSLLSDPQPSAPVDLVAPMPDPTPAETSVAAPVEPAVPVQKTTKAKTEKPGRKGASADEEDDVAGKDKYSIYLPSKLSMALRMVYIVTRKKFSHIAELALTDMLFRRYRCHNPDCLALFSISEKDATPCRCPVCGKKDFHPYRLDVLE